MSERGRPTTYDEETASRIVELMAEGEPLAVICRRDDMPGLRTVYNWQDANAGFKARIARARLDGYDMIAADCLEIADETGNDTKYGKNGEEMLNGEWVARSKIRIETRLKLLAKWDPRRYGEKIALTGGDENDSPIAVRLDGLTQAQREAIAAARLEGE